MRPPWWLPFGSVPELRAPALFQALQGLVPPQLVDVRTSNEFAAGHIEGALHVPINELARRLPELELDPGRPVVAICLTAHRSIPAVRLIRGHGLEARQLAGGMLAWRASGLPERRRETAEEAVAAEEHRA
jgi:rhodanese-related sulfurtransferase